jgi:hypothetical protein
VRVNTPRLIWGPVYEVLEERIANGDDILLIVVPYVKLEALERLHSALGQDKRLKIISRWALRDLAGGASDLAVYPYLRDRRCELYLHPDIHLKLYVFRSNLALITSGNLTGRGLGYRERANIEIGIVAPLLADDWRNLYDLIDDSYRVDDQLFYQIEQSLRSIPQQPVINWPVVLPKRKKYTIGSLPASQTPAAFQAFYLSVDRTPYNSEDLRRAAHDLALYRVPAGLEGTEFNDRVAAVFKMTPFVVDFVEYLKHHGTLRFGAVNNWIHEKCEDVPLPYKWEIKENTRILYNWLAHFYAEIEWNIPGEHSQVIYWRGSTKQELPDSGVVLRDYQKMFSNLSNRERADEWKYVSNGAAPHQPLLLLAVIALYDKDPQRSNMVVLDDELERIFESSFSIVVVPQHPTSVVMPFIALRNEQFWHLKKRRAEAEIEGRIRSRGDFDQVYLGARLDEKLHELMQSSPMRVALRETILDTYFPEPIRRSLRALSEGSSLPAG